MNQFLRGRTVHRETGDAETRGNVLVAQQPIGGDPARNFPASCRACSTWFRHQDDEFVAAIARHHIRTPAILFKNVANALQHHVAFQVPIKIVHEFEAVQVHQHQRKRAVGASGALPFGGKRFHQEAMRLDAGQPIGNGLLLRLLESQRIVKRSGEKVRQRAQQQHFLLGKIAGCGRFHIEHRQQLLAINHRQSDGGNASPAAPAGVEALASRTIATWPVRATCPSMPSPSAMRRPAASRRMPASAWMNKFLRRVVENRDADVVVGQAVFDFDRDFRQHFIGIERRDGVARNVVNQRQMARFFLLLRK